MNHLLLVPFRRIQTFLFAPKMSLWRYCIIALLIAAIPSILLSFLAHTTLGLAGIDTSSVQAPSRQLSAGSFLVTVVLGPLIETFIMGYILTVLSSTHMRTGSIALVSAFIWGAIHGLFGLLWFFGTVWAFFVMSCGYMFWRKQSYRQAYLAAAVPHVLNNLIAMSALATFN